ncbi:hypothetical protein ID007_004311 [Salmonella enterica]|nr:hypothetical protein [Salmonella enterica]
MPLLIRHFEGCNPFWPSDVAGGEAYRLLSDYEAAGQRYEVMLEDNPEGSAFVYVRCADGLPVGHFTLAFDYTPPPHLPGRLPQVVAASVIGSHRGEGIANHVYRELIRYYGAVISDTHQTKSGMGIWLHLATHSDLELRAMQLDGTVMTGRKSYTRLQVLLEEGEEIWNAPQVVQDALEIEHLGFRPAWRHEAEIVLLAALKPARKTLRELLEGSTPEDYELTDEDRVWLNSPPVGRELI